MKNTETQAGQTVPLNSLVRGDFILDEHINSVFTELRKRAGDGEPFERFEFIEIWLNHAERLILEPPNASNDASAVSR